MSDLSDVERDALHVVRALEGLNRHLGRSLDGARSPEGAADQLRILQALVDEGGAAGERVLAYLRMLRGAGDGVATAYPPRLGPWRDWCPPRGDLLTRRSGMAKEAGRSVPRPVRRGDPGE
jgi:hypothetical protein